MTMPENQMIFRHFCDPEGIQTPNLLIRSQMLYSVKLRDHFSCQGANIVIFILILFRVNISDTAKYFKFYIVGKFIP